MEQIDIQLNGEPRRVPSNLTVRQLLTHLEIDPERVAVELNRAIVRKTNWDSTQVPAGAEVEVVQFVGGG